MCRRAFQHQEFSKGHIDTADATHGRLEGRAGGGHEVSVVGEAEVRVCGREGIARASAASLRPEGPDDGTAGWQYAFEPGRSPGAPANVSKPGLPAGCFQLDSSTGRRARLVTTGCV